MAEESSRPAFQSIESLVHAFGSVSFMLESTFNAIYNSFRAVLAVAENFGRLRTMFGQVYSTFAVMRILQWLYKKLLYLIGECIHTHTHTHKNEEKQKQLCYLPVNT